MFEWVASVARISKCLISEARSAWSWSAAAGSSKLCWKRNSRSTEWWALFIWYHQRGPLRLSGHPTIQVSYASLREILHINLCRCHLYHSWQSLWPCLTYHFVAQWCDFADWSFSYQSYSYMCVCYSHLWKRHDQGPPIEGLFSPPTPSGMHVSPPPRRLLPLNPPSRHTLYAPASDMPFRPAEKQYAEMNTLT